MYDERILEILSDVENGEIVGFVIPAKLLYRIWDIRVYFEEWAEQDFKNEYIDKGLAYTDEIKEKYIEEKIKEYIEGDIFVSNNGKFYHSVDKFDFPVDEYNETFLDIVSDMLYDFKEYGLIAKALNDIEFIYR